MNSWKDRKRGRGGKHDSNVKFEEFIKTYNKIDICRETTLKGIILDEHLF